jgi:hypothetical protein
VKAGELVRNLRLQDFIAAEGFRRHLPPDGLAVAGRRAFPPGPWPRLPASSTAPTYPLPCASSTVATRRPERPRLHGDTPSHVAGCPGLRVATVGALLGHGLTSAGTAPRLCRPGRRPGPAGGRRPGRHRRRRWPR